MTYEDQEEVTPFIAAEGPENGVSETPPTCQTVTRTRTWTQTGTRPIYQGVDASKLVPLLTKALQEAITEIEDLKARVNTLEGN